MGREQLHEWASHRFQVVTRLGVLQIPAPLVTKLAHANLFLDRIHFRKTCKSLQSTLHHHLAELLDIFCEILHHNIDESELFLALDALERRGALAIVALLFVREHGLLDHSRSGETSSGVGDAHAHVRFVHKRGRGTAVAGVRENGHHQSAILTKLVQNADTGCHLAQAQDTLLHAHAAAAALDHKDFLLLSS